VSGDFVDVVPAGAAGWGLVVGDVSGNGAAAAAVAGWARRALRAATADEEDPCLVLGRLNRMMLAQAADAERFLSAAYVTVRTTVLGAHAVVCTAGHPPVLVRRPDGTIRRVAGDGTLLGVIPDAGLVARRVPLRRGDTILLYTDGVTEARRGDERYGQRRLESLFARIGGLRPRAVARLVARAALTFGAAQPDDITVLAARVP
jgi:serine phosphatase RsbU (regulator of sigma subunit)